MKNKFSPSLFPAAGTQRMMVLGCAISNPGTSQADHRAKDVRSQMQVRIWVLIPLSECWIKLYRCGFFQLFNYMNQQISLKNKQTNSHFKLVFPPLTLRVSIHKTFLLSCSDLMELLKVISILCSQLSYLGGGCFCVSIAIPIPGTWRIQAHQ